MGKIRIYGETSGYVDIQAPAVASEATIELPDVPGPLAAKNYVDASVATAGGQMLEKAAAPTDGAYTLELADVGKVVTVDASEPTTVTVPTFAEGATPEGARLDVFNEGPERVELAAGAGVTIQNFQAPPFYIPKFGTALLRRRRDNTWAAWGDITGFLPITATGGDTVEDVEIGGVLYRIHQFTTVGSAQSFDVSSLGSSNGEIDYLIVAGGGGGGSHGPQQAGGGGGAGGLLSGAEVVSVQSYPLSVGAGGGVQTSGTYDGLSGGNSSAFGLTAVGGGGGGGNQDRDGGSGGSGGGRASGGGGGAGGAGTSGQGFQGGGNGSQGSPYYSGGGGGAAQRGQDVFDSPASYDGGDGKVWAGTGESYAGGGGGGERNSGVKVGAGGVGGGGDGGRYGVNNAQAGENGRGGGGGGGAGGPSPLPGAPGGSGIVIVRYPLVAV